MSESDTRNDVGEEPLNCETVLLVCGQGPGHDGAFLAVDINSGDKIELIDPIGSFVCLVGERLYRILAPTTSPPGTADLLTYDTDGVLEYHRLDEMADVHGIWWDGTSFGIPCSTTNEIIWVDVHGRRVRTWRAPGEDDSWHVNGLCFKDGRWYASAFARCSTKQEMLDQVFHGLRPGVIVDVESMEPVLSGLDCPHDPLFADDAWIMCNSRTHLFTKIHPETQEVLSEIKLSGWTRGVEVGSDCFYVGESAERHPVGEPGRASIAVVDRRTFNLKRRISLPCVEVNTMRLVPKTFLRGLRKAFRTNGYRVSLLDRYSIMHNAGSEQPNLGWTRMDPLPASDCWINVEVLAPESVQPATDIRVPVRVSNRASKSLLSTAPNPVYLSYQWRSLDDSKRPMIEGQRAPLESAIKRDESFSTVLSIRAPGESGRYELLITLVQEWVQWFHEAHPSNVFRCEVRVEGASEPPRRPVNAKAGVPGD